MRKNTGLTIVFIACAFVFVASCAHMTVPAVANAPDNIHCPGGKGHPHESGPIICIDAITLAADPDGQPVHQGAWIHFYLTDTSQQLDIQFKKGGDMEFENNNGNEVSLRVKDKATLGKASYWAINVSTGKKKDPEIVIEP